MGIRGYIVKEISVFKTKIKFNKTIVNIRQKKSVGNINQTTVSPIHTSTCPSLSKVSSKRYVRSCTLSSQNNRGNKTKINTHTPTPTQKKQIELIERCVISPVHTTVAFCGFVFFSHTQRSRRRRSFTIFRKQR